MGKNIAMLKCFSRVLKNDKKEIEKILPNMYAKSFYTIDVDFLLKQKINKLILDIDGTILPVDDTNVPDKLIKRIEEIKNKNIEVCLVSNNNEERVEPVAKKLKINYLANAHKPLKEAYENAIGLLNAKKDNVAMVGDQMMSDIKGANEYGIYTILVKPVSKHNNIKTGTSRFLQNIMEKHLKKQKLFDSNKYYKKGMIKWPHIMKQILIK